MATDTPNGDTIWRGDLSVEHESFDPNGLDPVAMENVQVQRVRASDEERIGVGVLEQFFIGPTLPRLFERMLDGAKE